jgi:hypothetical protein
LLTKKNSLVKKASKGVNPDEVVAIGAFKVEFFLEM